MSLAFAPYWRTGVSIAERRAPALANRKDAVAWHILQRRHWVLSNAAVAFVDRSNRRHDPSHQDRISRRLSVAISVGGRDESRVRRAALMPTSRDWARTAASDDLERTLSFWSDDAIVMPPGQPAVVGKAAIREFVRQTLAIPGFSITWEPEQATVANDADLGFMVERNRVTFAEATGVIREQFGKAVTVWRKDSRGGWKCVVDTWNENPTERALPV